MGDVLFYHLTLTPLEETLPTLLTKSLAAGWRVAIVAQDAAKLDWLDRQLWLGRADSFLPHGLAGGPHDADQPVLLTTGRDLPNGATCVMTIDGAELDPAQIATLARVCILFDGHDPDALAHARGQWKALTAAGVTAQYWSQDSGRWEKKAQSGGA